MLSSSAMAADGATLHRLEGTSGTEAGGLTIMKKCDADDNDGEDATAKTKHVFAPRSSLLGLDRLASEKRRTAAVAAAAAAAEGGAERSKVTSYHNDWEDEDVEEEDGDGHDEAAARGHRER